MVEISCGKIIFYLPEEPAFSTGGLHTFSYENFSEGEKMRIDLSLLLAWREIARAKNSINCNLLILDEVFDSSLDSVGMDELMKLLKMVNQWVRKQLIILQCNGHKDIRFSSYISAY